MRCMVIFVVRFVTMLLIVFSILVPNLATILLLFVLMRSTIFLLILILAMIPLSVKLPLVCMQSVLSRVLLFLILVVDMSTKRFLSDRNRDRFAHCVRHEGERDVQSGLAMTPSQVFKMAEKGLPVTTHNLGLVYDEGYSNLDFTPPLEYRRGVDLGDLYEARMDAKVKLRSLRDSGQFKNANVEGAATE